MRWRIFKAVYIVGVGAEFSIGASVGPTICWPPTCFMYIVVGLANTQHVGLANRPRVGFVGEPNTRADQ